MFERISLRHLKNRRFAVFLILGFCFMMLAVIYFQTSTSHAVHKCPSSLGQNVAHQCLDREHPTQRIERAANQYCNRFSNPMKNGRCKIFFKRGALGVAFNAGDGGQMCRDLGGNNFEQKCRQAFQTGKNRFPPPGPDNRDANNPNRGARNPGGGGGRSEPAGIGEAGKYTCGTFVNEDRNVKTRFDFGCVGTDFDKLGDGQKDSSNIKNISPILDLIYAFIRFMSVGVGIVLAISIIVSGIQYSMSEGNAEITQKAKARIRSAILGLGIYIFAFSMLQFLVPGGVFKPGLWLDDSIMQFLIRLGL